MVTKVNKDGRTGIPSVIRRRYHIRPGDRLVWLDDGEEIRIIPVPPDPIAALRGSGLGENLVERLILNRRTDT